VPPRIDKRYAVIEFKIKRHNDKKTNYTVIYSIIAFNKSKGFVPSHSNTLIPPSVATVAAYYQIFCYPSKTKNK
jgi:hypothetical protein